MKYLITLSILFFSFHFQAQTICLGQDLNFCPGASITIQNCNNNNIGAAGINLTAPSSVSLSDDVWSGVVNLGFTFNFFGNNYTQCVIGSNGLISFNTNQANTYCPWGLAGGPLPNATITGARNSIMLTYQDINPSLGGQIQYQTIGTAPNRKFVVLYKNIYMFSCTTQCNYMALILYESTNVYEMHIGNKPICNSWNSGLAIQGSENNAMTVAFTTPGRNNSVWGANQDGRRYTPASPTNTSSFTITQIPYIMVNSPGSNYVWQSISNGVLGPTYPYNNGNLVVSPLPTTTTGYFLAGSACGASVGSITADTSWLTPVFASVSASMTPDICSSGIGTVTATATGGTAPYSFTWPTLGAGISNTALNTFSVDSVQAGTYTVFLQDSQGCTGNATITVTDTPASFTATSTLISCPGGSDGTATAVMTPPLGNITYLWDDLNAQTTATATGLTAGTYNCVITSDVGCTGNVTVDVNEIPGMIATISNQTDVTCNSGNDGMAQVTVTQGTAPYTYSWDNSTSILDMADDLSAGIHVVTVTDANSCATTATVTLSEPPALAVATLTPPTMICPEASIILSATGTGGSSPYTYTWSQNGTVIGTGPSITVDPDVTNTQYCVVLSEACGSPTADSCTIITFPTPIVPSMTPYATPLCTPGFFEFSNTSSNSSEIATTYFEFSDNSSFIEQGIDSTSNTFETPGFYSATMTVTSIYGCVYVDSFPNIVEVLPLPIADFTFSSNPATFFETSIQLQDRSTNDVVDWEWFSPGSNPTNSNAQNPQFYFPEGVVGQYPVTLIVTTELGCSDTVTLIMNVVPDVIFYAPNTFTPDNDEHNQAWEIFVDGIDIYHFDLYIFNRWGEMIWESHDPKAKWDGSYNGQIVPAGMYVWKATAKDSLNDKKYEFNGHINVLR